MKVVTDDRIAAFVGEKVDTIIYPPWTVMGIEKHGEIIAGCVFNCFTGHDIHVTVAGSGFTKGFLSDVGQYLFGELKCERVTLVTEQPKIVRIGERLGGSVEGLLRNHFGVGRDGFIVGILKNEYRF